MANASSVSWPPTSAPRCIAASRFRRQSCPRPANASRASCRPLHRGQPSPAQACRCVDPALSLHGRRDDDAGQAGSCWQAVRERQNILIARRHQHRQDHLGERAAGRNRRHGRPRAGARRHGGAAMRGPRSRTAAHAPGVVSMTELVRSVHAPASGPRGRRRGARRRGTGSHQGLGHRPPRRHRHDPRRLRAGRAPAPGATDSGSGGEPAPRADRGSGQRGHPHRRARTQAPHRSDRSGRRLRRLGLPTGGCAGGSIPGAAAAVRPSFRAP